MIVYPLIQLFDAKRQTRRLQLGHDSLIAATRAVRVAVGVAICNTFCAAVRVAIGCLVGLDYRLLGFCYHTLKRPILSPIEPTLRTLPLMRLPRAYEKRDDLLPIPALPCDVVSILIWL